jgi:hypothetical protein
MPSLSPLQPSLNLRVRYNPFFHIRTLMPPRPTPTSQRWAPERFHSRTNSRTLFSASSHATSSNPLPFPTSPVVCSPDCVLNHEQVLTTQFSDLLGFVESLPHGSSPLSHHVVTSQRPLSHTTLTRLVPSDSNAREIRTGGAAGGGASNYQLSSACKSTLHCEMDAFDGV